ncbi:MAG TPA: nucleoside-diphosphate sugar epimerase/dehydratase [Tissierellaceae bacterium]|nr:nucleoside-diphosphate sugar epimerase/dehydratase [Tissierellaceae bacterium]
MRKKRTLFLVLLDILFINISYVLSVLLRFGGKVPSQFLNISLYHVLIITGIKISIYYIFKLYKNIWKYASIDELMGIVIAVLVGNIVTVTYMSIAGIFYTISLSLIVPALEILFIGGSRFAFRAIKMVDNGFKPNKNAKRVIIIGAGAAGVMTLKELRNHRQLYRKPLAFIDDDPTKIGKIINRVPVLGDRKDIDWICEKYDIDEIIIAIPSAERKDIKDIIKQCKKTNCKTKILPGVYELLDGKISVSKIRDVQIEDLLGRDEISLDLEELSKFINGKRVMVTGGGGSIGSELCRQIVNYSPKTLMILDIYENSVYDLQNELLKQYPDLNLEILIASIRDTERIDEIMCKKRPQIVFHAAAHKHVPLMEYNPKAAIKNNVFGTLNMVQASSKYGVNKFVMISTDKAVNPTNVMGATKRIGEMIIQAFNNCSNTDYVAVRFGNVLGSNGSVIPLFKRQIKDGGPVTVTDKRIVRYFMTIPEACQLVLQSGSMATGGEIFVLDMGEQVKIVDLAKDLIRLSGFKPDVDIQIKFIGLRPGEKLYEEILLNKDEMAETSHNKIYIEKPKEFKYNDIMEYMGLLNEALKKNNREDIRSVIQSIVPSYQPYVPDLMIEESATEINPKEITIEECV